jgi:tetratricopeptide (TPR) repeat protein
MLRVQQLALALGDPRAALSAARTALELVPLDDEDALVHTRQTLVDLHRMLGEYDDAIGHLDHIVRDRPHDAHAIEQIADLYIAKGDWPTATRFLYQLVPLAHTTHDKAEQLYRLGEAILVHLGDIDRADDVFLRASDIEPTHVPTLRRLLDVYWRADDPAALVEVATELTYSSAFVSGPIAGTSLAQALVAAALIGDAELATKLVAALGDEAPRRVAASLAELSERKGRLELATASTAIAELGRRGVLDLAKVRAAASGTPAESALG